MTMLCFCKKAILFCQVPGQDILQPYENYREMELTVEVAGDQHVEAAGGQQVDAAGDQLVEGGEPKKEALVPMRSAKFLLLHVFINTAIMGMASTYIFFSRSLDAGSDDAIVIPQILGVIPGFLFAMGQSILMPDICPENISTPTTCGKVSLRCVFCTVSFKHPLYLIASAYILK